jgi:isopropylmalate/homocitrate/citramalate synthase
MKPFIRVSEVGPRDGLQNIKTVVPLAVKQAWIAAEAAAGVREIEVGSFVNPKLLPQLADTQAVVEFARGIPTRSPCRCRSRKPTAKRTCGATMPRC